MPVDVFGVELSAIPSHQRIVFFVRGVRDGFEEHFESRRTADIFGRCPVLAVDEPWQTRAGFGFEDVQNIDAMFPVVTEVIGIEETLGNHPIFKRPVS